MSQKVSLYMKLYMFSLNLDFPRHSRPPWQSPLWPLPSNRSVRFLADRRQLQIARANDIVPPVDGLCRVTAEAHGDVAGDACPFHVPNRAATKIMEVQALKAGCLAGALPTFQVGADLPIHRSGTRVWYLDALMRLFGARRS